MDSTSTPPVLDAAVRARLHEVFPDAEVERATWIGAGWGSVAFRVPAPGGDWAVRVPRPGVPWAVGDLEREARMLPLLATRPFEVAVPTEPRLLRDDEGRTVAAVHRLVPGESSRTLRGLRGRVRADLLASIGRFLSVLHTTPLAEAREHGIEGRDVWGEVSLQRIEETIALAGPRTRAWLASRVDAYEALDAKPVPGVIHGDLGGDHLLVDETGRLSGVIDFAEARISDPALDFAGVLNRFSWRDLEVVRRHYTAPLDATFMERARIYIEIVPIYSVTDGYVAAGEAERRQGLRRLARRAALDVAFGVASRGRADRNR